MLHLVVATDGSILGIYGEEIELASLGSLRIARASLVDPDASGRWTADLTTSGGPVLGPFSCRSQALVAEVDWLLEHRLALSKE